MDVYFSDMADTCGLRFRDAPPCAARGGPWEPALDRCPVHGQAPRPRASPHLETDAPSGSGARHTGDTVPEASSRAHDTADERRTRPEAAGGDPGSRSGVASRPGARSRQISQRLFVEIEVGRPGAEAAPGL